MALSENRKAAIRVIALLVSMAFMGGVVLSRRFILWPAWIFFSILSCLFVRNLYGEKIYIGLRGVQKNKVACFLAYGLALFLALFALGYVYSYAFHTDIHAKHLNTNSINIEIIRSILFSSIIIPACEEFVFRGYISREILWITKRCRWRNFLSILVSSVTFSVAHVGQHTLAVIWSFVGGIVFSYIFIKEDQILLPSFLVHASVNFYFLFFYFGN